MPQTEILKKCLTSFHPLHTTSLLLCNSVKFIFETFCVCLDQSQTMKKIEVKAITNNAYEPEEAEVKQDKNNVFQNQCKISSEVKFDVDYVEFGHIELI